ncbi:hypothetical protein SLS58_002306 [Diplodia intermedia]|uniref:Uncharacterized protein n=1 Tax=Diplodia intermedia TaxID=856260 RepID=A0ABR3TZH0_9PEZI
MGLVKGLPRPSPYDPDMCLDCARACLAALQQDYESVRQKLLKGSDLESSSKNPHPKERVKRRSLPSMEEFTQRRKQQDECRKMLKLLAKDIRTATCRVVNADLAAEAREESREWVERELRDAFDGEATGGEAGAAWRAELEKLFARAAGAKAPAEYDQPSAASAFEREVACPMGPHSSVQRQTYLDVAPYAGGPKDGAARAVKSTRKVSFAPDVFDELDPDPDSEQPKRRDRIAYFNRMHPAYRPGAHAGKAYCDTSGWLQDPDDYGADTQVEDPKYRPVRTLGWFAEPSTYATPMVILTNELGESQTLVRATLPEEEPIPFVTVVDPEVHILRLVTSTLIQKTVDRFLTRPKPRARSEMVFQQHYFYDDIGMERNLFWVRGDLWIKTSYTRRIGGKKATLDIYSEPWYDCVEYAKRQKALRVICEWVKKWKTERTSSIEGMQAKSTVSV